MGQFDNLYAHGFVRIAAASPRVALADPAANARETIELMRQADKAGAAVCVFPELGLSGYTLDDLHLQSALLDHKKALITRMGYLNRQVEIIRDHFNVDRLGTCQPRAQQYCRQ